MKITDVLKYGIDNALTADEIAAIMGLTRRQVTQMVEVARRSGSPIVASCGKDKSGYYLTSDANELSVYCEQLRHREREISKTRKALQRILKRIRQ